MSTNKRSTYEEEIAALMNVRLEDTQFYKDIAAEGRIKGARSIVTGQLKYLFSDISEDLLAKVEKLSLEHLKGLAIALLDFSSISDLESFLQQKRFKNVDQLFNYIEENYDDSESEATLELLMNNLEETRENYRSDYLL